MKFYKCPLCCNLGFTSKNDLKKHLSKAAASITCPGCYKSFKNVLFLIKHLDQCDASNESQAENSSGCPETVIDSVPSPTDDEKDDDVEGYYCTVCNIKIPDINKHIQQFHCGQEVILQDDNDSDSSTSPSCLNSCPVNSCLDKIQAKCEREDTVNVRNMKNERFRKGSTKQKEEIYNEMLYCPKCDVCFTSLEEHTANCHAGGDVVVQDLSVHELFPESIQKNGTFSYFCSCCQKTIVRKSTLVKHLKLDLYNEERKRAGKTVYQRNEGYSSNSLHDPFRIEAANVDGEKLVHDEPYEVEEMQIENYELDGIGHSIFNT